MVFIPIVVVLLLVLLNGLFAMSELAVVSARRARLQALADRGDKGAKMALAMAEHPTRFLSAVQVGITLIGILAGAYGQASIAGSFKLWIASAIPPLAPWAEIIATAIVVIGITYVSLILGELVPKRMALLFPEVIARRMAPFLSLLALVLRPFVTLLSFSTTAVLKLFRVSENQGASITNEEVDSVLAEGADAGLIEPEERSMIQEVMRLGDRPVRVAMTPRRDIFWISVDDPIDTIMGEIRDCPYSRIVAAGEGLDDHLGVILKKDLVGAVLSNEPIDIRSHIHQPISIPETMSLLRAMETFKQTPLHMAFVVDEFGSLEGVITAIDLLEMIAGDFNESHDEDDARLLRREDGSWLIDGRLDIQELNDTLGQEFEASSGYHTVAGLVLDELGRIPEEGEKFPFHDFDVEVLDMDGSRIDKVLFTPRPIKGQPEGDG